MQGVRHSIKDRKVGSEFIAVATLKEAKKLHPGAAWYQPVSGGYLAFRNYNDYQRWRFS